ncbi:MAG: hypothetical protein V7739_05160 [Motiliproteus sp.]
MKQLPEILNSAALTYAAAIKPLALVFAAALALLVGLSIARETGQFQVIAISLTYLSFQTFFLLGVLLGFRKLKSSQCTPGVTYVVARTGEWLNGIIILICVLLPTPFFLYVIGNWLFART